MDTPRIHAPYSPSKLEKLEICPGWLPDPTQDTTKADEGELMHLAVETGDMSGLQNNEQRAMVEQCIAFSENLTTKLEIVEDLKETRLEIPGVTHGYVDRLIRHRKHGKIFALILDWKMGVVPVTDAAYNRQGWAYTSGVFHTFDDVHGTEVMFALPRQDTISRHFFPRSRHAELDLVIRAIIERAKLYANTGDVALLNKTEQNCLYCGRKATCPVILKHCLILSNKYENLEMPNEVHASQITSQADAAKLYASLRIMEKMVDSGKKHLVELALQNDGLRDEHGNLIYEVAERAGTRTIKDQGMAYCVFREYLELEELAQCSTIKLGEALKAASDKAAKGQKSKVRAQIETKLMDAQAISSGEPVRYLKRVSGGGKAIDVETTTISE